MNIVYWINHALDEKDVAALKIIKAGIVPRRYRFEVAFLIALGCVTFDEKSGALGVTDKGDDALQFFVSETKR